MSTPETTTMIQEQGFAEKSDRHADRIGLACVCGAIVVNLSAAAIASTDALIISGSIVVTSFTLAAVVGLLVPRQRSRRAGNTHPARPELREWERDPRPGAVMDRDGKSKLKNG